MDLYSVESTVPTSLTALVEDLEHWFQKSPTTGLCIVPAQALSALHAIQDAEGGEASMPTPRVPRSAISGRLVKKSTAAKNPRTTGTETVRTKKSGKAK